MKCINCGRELLPNARFCDKCGKPVSDAETFSGEDKRKDITGTPGKKKRQGSNKRKILVFILVFSLAAAGGIVYKKTGGLPDADSADITKEDVFVNEEVASQESESEPAENISDASEADTTSDNDVEEEVLSIRDRYNEITENISSGQYTETVLQDGITIYCDGSQLQAAVLQAGTNGNIYRRWYYYSDDDLIFAYYENEDSHRFYFKDHKMIRWRECKDAKNYDEGMNHDMESTAEYLQWESTVIQDSDMLKRTWDAGDTLGNGEEYILPGSDRRIITESELDGLTKEEVKLARNEIYARHGRKFDDEALTAYFSQFDWYYPSIEPEDFQESMLNSYEVTNRDIIVQYEEEKGYR